MAKNEVRDEQLTQAITDELTLILSTAADERIAELTVVAVHARAGGRHFTVMLRPPDSGGDPRILRGLLARAAGYVRYELGTSLNLKRTPEISPVLDPRAVG